MLQINSSFPVDACFDDLKKKLDQNIPVLLKAAPGAGKTTRVPLWLLEQAWVKDKKIIMLEPRRLAARHAAEFMAQQKNEKVGETIGYRVRLDHCVGPQTRIEVVTEAILSKMILKDPGLSEVACIVFDEFHERNLSSDIGLGLVLDMRDVYREDIRLMLMSATMDESQCQQNIVNLEVLESSGRQYPIEIEYVSGPDQSPDLNLMKKMLIKCLKNEMGDILVFLPGKKEIDCFIDMIQMIDEPMLDIYPLYSQLPYASQKQASAQKEQARRSVIVATDIAETSLTIPGVRIVIDSGFCREPFYDHRTGAEGIRLTKISKDSADQRAGRAGRLDKGKVIRCWSKAKHALLKPTRNPEIEQVNLEQTVLEVTAWGSNYESFSWITQPKKGLWFQAYSRLKQIKAIENEQVTPLGERLLSFPMEPRLARVMLYGKNMNCGCLAALVCTWWKSRDARTEGEADLELRLENFYHKMVRGQPQDENEYRDACKRIGVKPMKPEFDELSELLVKACPEQVAMQRPDQEHKYRLAQGGELKVHKEASHLCRSRFLFCPILFSNHHGEVQIKVALEINVQVVEDCILHEASSETCYQYDEEKGKVVLLDTEKWMELTLKQELKADGVDEEKADFFWKRLRRLSLKELPLSTGSRNWLNRYRLFNQLDETLVELNDDEVMNRADTWLKPYMSMIFTWKDFEKVDWLNAIKGLVDEEVNQRLELMLPSHIQVPSGSYIAIDYTEPEQPRLSVRIQEVFGLIETPSLMEGKVKLIIELLSPARRPIQVTTDLNSFWKGAYYEVRKELKRRYPKHAWPDKPLEAQAIRGVKANLKKKA